MRGDNLGTTATEPTSTARGRQHRDSNGRWLSGHAGVPDSCRHNSHGRRALRNTLNELAGEEDWLDALQDIGHVARDKRDALVNDQGGEDSLTEARGMLIKQLVLRELALESAWRYLLTTGGIVDKKKHKLRPLVLELEKLAGGQTRDLALLGLERRQHHLKSAVQLLAESREADAR